MKVLLQGVMESDDEDLRMLIRLGFQDRNTCYMRSENYI